MSEIHNALRSLIKTTLNATDAKIKKAPFDKTLKGKITQTLSSGKYKVMINGNEYTAKSKAEYNVNDIVYVLAPRGNYNDLIIIF